jgi:gliding motility-associated lipoprotein GldH
VIKNNIISIFVLSLIIGSCDSNRVFENTADINNAYWLADSIKSFEFIIPDERIGYNISFSIRNGVEFPHSNIYVQYIISDSTNNVLDEELRNFQLFHPKSGYPFGNGSGNLFEHKFDLLVDYKFPYNGPYKIKFQQYMRYDSLPQVYSIGVRVETPE